MVSGDIATSTRTRPGRATFDRELWELRQSRARKRGFDALPFAVKRYIVLKFVQEIAVVDR